MTRSEIAKNIQGNTGLRIRKCVAAIDCVFGNIGKELATGGVVSIRGFGTMSTVSKRARMGRNPKTGQLAVIPARRRVRMKLSRKWIDTVNRAQTGAKPNY